MTWEKHKQVLTPVTRSYGIAVMGMGLVIGLFTAFALAGTAHSGGVLLLLIPAAIFLNFVPTEKAAAPNACANRKPKRSPEFSCYSGGVVWHPLSISLKL
jgi:hypothetical protein